MMTGPFTTKMEPEDVDSDSSSELISASDNQLLAVDKNDIFFMEFREEATLSMSPSPPSPSLTDDEFYDDATDGDHKHCRIINPKEWASNKYWRKTRQGPGRPLASTSLQSYSGGYFCGGKRSTLSRAEMAQERKRILSRVPSSRNGVEGQGRLREASQAPQKRFRKLTGILRKKWFVLLKCCGLLALQKLKSSTLLFAPGLVLALLFHLIYFVGTRGSESLLLGFTSSTAAVTNNDLQPVELLIPKLAPSFHSQDLAFRPIYPENDLHFLMNSSSECQQRNNELQEENNILEDEISGLRQQYVEKLARKEGQFNRFKRAISNFRERHFCLLDIHVYLTLASLVILVNFLIYCFARHFY